MITKSNQLYLTRPVEAKKYNKNVKNLDLKCEDIPDEELLLHQRIHKAYTLLGSFRPGYKQKVKTKRLATIPHDDYSRLRMLSSNSHGGTGSLCSTCDGCSTDSNSDFLDEDFEDTASLYLNSQKYGSVIRRNSNKDQNGCHNSKGTQKTCVIDCLLLVLCRALIFLMVCLCFTFLTDFRAGDRYHVRSPYKKQSKLKSDVANNCSITFGADLQKIPLLSFPGSGNTWLRHLIEEISGTFTGSVYNDWRIYDKGFSGEYEDPMNGKVIVVKSHLGNPGDRNEIWKPSEEMFEYGKSSGGLRCIYLLRHPVDTYFSMKSFQKTRSHLGYLSYPDFHSMVGRRLWRSTVLDMSQYYVDTYTKLEESCSKGIKLVFYEDLVKNPWRLSKNLVTWIENINDDAKNMTRKKRSVLEIERNSRKNCFEMYSEGDFHRNHMPSEHDHVFPDDLFTEVEKKDMDLLMAKLNTTMDGRLPESYSFYEKK